MTTNQVNGFSRYWENDVVKKARKDHKCDGCKKLIKKGSSYLRRSFGKFWTWKACSEKCASKMEKLSSGWTR